MMKTGTGKPEQEIPPLARSAPSVGMTGRGKFRSDERAEGRSQRAEGYTLIWPKARKSGIVVKKTIRGQC